MHVRRHQILSQWFPCLLAALVVLTTRHAAAFDVVEASLSGRQIAVKSVVYVSEERQVVENVEVQRDGKTVVEKVAKIVIAKVPMMEERMVAIDAIKATDTTGKPIARDRVIALLGTPKLAVVGDVPADKRGVFREGTLFLEIAESK